MKWDRLIKGIKILKFSGELPQEIKNLCYDSRFVQPGDLFVALRGKLQDGHAYVGDAMKRGALAAVVEKVNPDLSLPQIQVENSRAALAAMACNYYDDPSAKLQVAVVTGTNGKTTTSRMLDSILKAWGKKTGIIGTVEVAFEDVSLPSILTTPESLDLQGHLHEMQRRGITHVSMEASSIGIESHRLDGLHKKVIAFNNLAPEHLDFHGTFDDYFQAKKKLFQNLDEDSVVVLNGDDEKVDSLKHELNNPIIRFSVQDQAADLLVKELDLSTGRARFTVERQGLVQGSPLDLQLHVPGYHSLSNALCAVSMALALGAPDEAIKQGLLEFRGVERRFEFIYEGDFLIIDDHFANKGNIDVTLKTLDFMEYERLFLLYAIRGNRGVQTNRENAESILAWDEALHFEEILVSLSEDCTDEKDRVRPEELEVFQEVVDGRHDYELFHNLEEAVEAALDRVQAGDALLLAGCQGMDYGGHMILKALHRRHPDWDEKRLFRALEHRVAGILPYEKNSP